MRSTSNQAHIHPDPGSGTIERQSQRDHIMNSNDGGGASKERGSKVGNVKEVNSSSTSCCWSSQLFPEHFFNVLVACRKGGHGCYTIGKPGLQRHPLR